jgi:hyaluronate lyase
VKDDDGAWSPVVTRMLQVNGPAPQAKRIILENGSPGTSSTGKWSVSSGRSPHGGGALSASGSGSYVFKLPIQAPGTYHVHVWWSDSASHSTKVPIDIQHAGGVKTVTVNQRSKGGRWNALGTFSFNTSATVTIRVVGKDKTCADAISLLPTGGTTPPPPARREVITLDNGGKGTSSKGQWQISGAPNPHGRDSLAGRNGATYRYTIPAVGKYRVQAWWTATQNRTAEVPIAIQHAGGAKVVNVNQKKDGGRWNLLGTFTFTKEAVITITAPGSRTSCADAVRLEPVN